MNNIHWIIFINFNDIIIKFDCTQNKTQNLIPVKCFESKIRKKNVPENNCNIKVLVSMLNVAKDSLITYNYRYILNKP